MCLVCLELRNLRGLHEDRHEVERKFRSFIMKKCITSDRVMSTEKSTIQVRLDQSLKDDFEAAIEEREESTYGKKSEFIKNWISAYVRGDISGEGERKEPDIRDDIEEIREGVGTLLSRTATNTHKISESPGEQANIGGDSANNSESTESSTDLAELEEYDPEDYPTSFTFTKEQLRNLDQYDIDEINQSHVDSDKLPGTQSERSDVIVAAIKHEMDGTGMRVDDMIMIFQNVTDFGDRSWEQDYETQVLRNFAEDPNSPGEYYKDSSGLADNFLRDVERFEEAVSNMFSAIDESVEDADTADDLVNDDGGMSSAVEVASKFPERLESWQDRAQKVVDVGHWDRVELVEELADLSLDALEAMAKTGQKEVDIVGGIPEVARAGYRQREYVKLYRWASMMYSVELVGRMEDDIKTINRVGSLEDNAMFITGVNASEKDEIDTEVDHDIEVEFTRDLTDVVATDKGLSEEDKSRMDAIMEADPDDIGEEEEGGTFEQEDDSRSPEFGI